MWKNYKYIKVFLKYSFLLSHLKIRHNCASKGFTKSKVLRKNDGQQ